MEQIQNGKFGCAGVADFAGLPDSAKFDSFRAHQIFSFQVLASALTLKLSDEQIRPDTEGVSC